MNQNDNSTLLKKLTEEQNRKIKEIIKLEEKLLKYPIVTIDKFVSPSKSVNVVASNFSDVIAVATLDKKDEFKLYNLFLNILFYYAIIHTPNEFDKIRNTIEFKHYTESCNNETPCVYTKNIKDLGLDIDSLLLQYVLCKLWQLLRNKIIQKKSINDIFVEMSVLSRMNNVDNIYCLFKKSLELYNVDNLLKNKMMEKKTEILLNQKNYQKLIQKYVKQNMKNKLTFQHFIEWLDNIQKNVENSFFIKAEFKHNNQSKILSKKDAQKLCDRYCGLLTIKESYESFSYKQPQSKICKIEDDCVYLCIKNIAWIKSKCELGHEIIKFINTISNFEETIDNVTYLIHVERETHVVCTQHKLITDYESLDPRNKDRVSLYFENFMKKCKTKFENTCGLNIKTGMPEKGTCVGEEFVKEGKNKECVFVKNKAKERNEFIEQKQKEIFMKERQSSKIEKSLVSVTCKPEHPLISHIPDDNISCVKIDDTQIYTITVPKKVNEYGVNFNNGKCEKGQVAGSVFCTQEGSTKKCIPLKSQEIVKKRKEMVKKTKFLFGNDRVMSILQNKEIKISSFKELLVYIDSDYIKQSLINKYKKLDYETKKYIHNEFKFIISKRMYNHNCTLFIADGVPFTVCNPVLEVFEDFGLSNCVNISSLSSYPFVIEEPKTPPFKILIDGLQVDNQLTELFTNPLMSIMQLFSRSAPAVPAACCKKTTRINKDGTNYIHVDGYWIEELEESKEPEPEPEQDLYESKHNKKTTETGETTAVAKAEKGETGEKVETNDEGLRKPLLSDFSNPDPDQDPEQEQNKDGSDSVYLELPGEQKAKEDKKEKSQKNITFHDYGDVPISGESNKPEGNTQNPDFLSDLLSEEDPTKDNKHSNTKERTVENQDDDGTAIKSQYSSLPDGPPLMFPFNEGNDSEEDEQDSVLGEFQKNVGNDGMLDVNMVSSIQ